MTKTVALLCVFVSVALASTTTAQETVQLEKFRVLLTTGERLEGRDGLLGENELTGVSSNDTALAIPREEIRALDRSLGSKGGKTALMGAGIGLATGLLAYIAAESKASSDPNLRVDNSRVAPLILGFTGVGALIGWAVGSGSERWEKVPVQVALSMNDGAGGFRMILRIPI